MLTLYAAYCCAVMSCSHVFTYVGIYQYNSWVKYLILARSGSAHSVEKHLTWHSLRPGSSSNFPVTHPRLIHLHTPRPKGEKGGQKVCTSFVCFPDNRGHKQPLRCSTEMLSKFATGSRNQRLSKGKRPLLNQSLHISKETPSKNT